jgi:hypothetical protein
VFDAARLRIGARCKQQACTRDRETILHTGRY